MKPHFSSLRLDWKTPKAVYQVLDAEFSFDFDPCPVNPQFDGLSVEWGESNFVNPPYGRELPKWIEKGFKEWRKGKTVVFLIPSMA
jgi:site-specific DNA-methyltransferase (adenine-specific)